MHTLVIDYETYVEPRYSLRVMPTLLYIRDPRFLIYGAGVKFNQEPAQWVRGPELEDYFATLPWSEITEITHNSLFDRTITYEKFGHVPARRVDTAGLCRALLPRDLDFDLDSIGQLLKLGAKVGGGAIIDKCRGLRELTPELEAEMAEYAIGDAELEYKLFALLYEHLPEAERRFMNLTIRMACEGTLRFDASMGAEVEAAIEEDRNHKLSIVGCTAEQLRSRDQFAELLRARGVEPPTKISPRTGEVTYAFSKQDPGYVMLGAHPDVADLIAARNAWASNNAITRVRNLSKISDLPPHTLPVQVNYNGAHTGRLSGGGGINMQNLNARGPQKRLRHAITAPPGCVIVVKDLSGIELRTNMWFSGQHDVLELIREGGDPYVEEAMRQFDCPREEVDKPRRNYGKVIQLACGYGMGHRKFRVTCAIGPMGNDPIYITEEEAQRTINTYRQGVPRVVGSWYWLQDQLPAMTFKGTHIELGPIVIEHEAILLPNGLRLQYPGLTCTEDGDWVWGLNGKVHRIYGGVMQENCVQSLAGIVVKEQMLEIDTALQANYETARIVHQVHDEVLTVCRERDAEDVAALMDEIMSTPRPWAPDLPLTVEGGWDFRYTK